MGRPRLSVFETLAPAPTEPTELVGYRSTMIPWTGVRDKDAAHRARDFCHSLVVGHPFRMQQSEPTPRTIAELMLVRLKRRANDGFGVVPVFDSFTWPSDPTAPPCTLPVGFDPAQTVLAQFSTDAGHQVLIQTAPWMFSTQIPLHAGLQKYLVVTAESGSVDLLYLRAFIPLGGLVPGFEQIPFQRVERLATPAEVASLTTKRAMERFLLQEVLNAVEDAQADGAIVVDVHVQTVEIRADGLLLVVFCDVPRGHEMALEHELQTRIGSGLGARVHVQYRVHHPV